MQYFIMYSSHTPVASASLCFICPASALLRMCGIIDTCQPDTVNGHIQCIAARRVACKESSCCVCVKSVCVRSATAAAVFLLCCYAAQAPLHSVLARCSVLMMTCAQA